MNTNPVKIIIVGAFHEIIELAEDNGIEIIGLIDNNLTGSYKGYKILCIDKDAPYLNNTFKKIPLLITPDIPQIRCKLYKYYLDSGFIFTSLFSLNSTISKSAIIQEGTVIQSGVNVSAECNIGKFVKLNTKCNVMHNTRIGDFSTIAPNAVTLGNSLIGSTCYIGSNSTILPNTSICDNVVIGAGAVVTKNITKAGIYAGIPAKFIKNI